MHEYSIVAALIASVEQTARAHGAERVHRLHVDIGELAGVELDLLKTAFDTFRARTICDGSELLVHSIAARWACPQCGLTLCRGAVLHCRNCDRPARLVSGDEITLRRIEMEASHV